MIRKYPDALEGVACLSRILSLVVIYDITISRRQSLLQHIFINLLSSIAVSDMREVLRDHNTSHHNDGETSSPLDTPITISEKPILPPSIIDSEWKLVSQMRADQELLKSRGLAPYKSLSLAWDHLAVRGVGAPDNIEYGSSMALFLAPRLRRKYHKKTALLSAARSDLPAGAEKGRR